MSAHKRTPKEEFTAYFVSNYPGPTTIISDPLWHAPRIFRAAKHALHHDELVEALQGCADRLAISAATQKLIALNDPILVRAVELLAKVSP